MIAYKLTPYLFLSSAAEIDLDKLVLTRSFGNRHECFHRGWTSASEWWVLLWTNFILAGLFFSTSRDSTAVAAGSGEEEGVARVGEEGGGGWGYIQTCFWSIPSVQG